MKRRKRAVVRFYFLAAAVWLHSGLIFSQSLRGVVTDAGTQEALPGVHVAVKNTPYGTVSNADGTYELKLPDEGWYTIRASSIAYVTVEVTGVEVKAHQSVTLNLTLRESVRDIAEVTVVARKDREAENMLMEERQQAAAALENIGAKEMALKGLSNVAEGVKKIAGISMEENRQVYVRGLGDRYSMTSLNGLPVASPNPDRKLIPLTLFPASVVRILRRRDGTGECRDPKRL
jgi:hypothetical protein